MVNDGTIRLPLAVYGKSESGGDAGGYRFLARHPAFDPPALERALRRLVTALEWKPAGHRHRPVFGTLGAGEQTLVARFLDVGRDANGRPHVLRVECVLWSDGLMPAALLESEAWEARDEGAAMAVAVAVAVFRIDGNAEKIRREVEGVIRIFGNGEGFSCGPGTRIGESA